MATYEPKRELVIKVVAMPSDLNPHGDMFGGWIVSQMASRPTSRTSAPLMKTSWKAGTFRKI